MTCKSTELAEPAQISTRSHGGAETARRSRAQCYCDVRRPARPPAWPGARTAGRSDSVVLLRSSPFLRGSVFIHVICIILLSIPGRGAAQDLRIAAASDLQAVMPQAVERFQQQTGQRVAVTFGSSGNFMSQIQNGAPFDLFFSADEAYPEQLERGGLAEPGSRYVYGIGRIVVWVRKDSRLDVGRGLRLLTDERVRKVAIANPEHAPYGRAAVAALEHEGLAAAVTPKFVLGENISQAAQFVQSGNAEVGIIALSLALSQNLKSLGDYWTVPDTFHPPLRQAAIIVRASPRKDAARRFLAFLRQPDISQLMQASGFALPPRAAP